MRYYPEIDLPYLSDSQSLVEACDALQPVIRSEIDSESGIVCTDLNVSMREGRTLSLRATLAGTDPAMLTSPLKAITVLDAWLNRSLLTTGLYEEFDVARRSLWVTAEPSEPLRTRGRIG